MPGIQRQPKGITLLHLLGFASIGKLYRHQNSCCTSPPHYTASCSTLNVCVALLCL
jgi:hypothetical protein